MAGRWQASTGARDCRPGQVLPGPVPLPSRAAVRPEWIDHNGHMNLAYYVVLFDAGNGRALGRRSGSARHYRAATGFGTFAVETHTLYRAELLSRATTTTAR